MYILVDVLKHSLTSKMSKSSEKRVIWVLLLKKSRNELSAPALTKTPALTSTQPPPFAEAPLEPVVSTLALAPASRLRFNTVKVSISKKTVVEANPSRTLTPTLS